MSLLLAFAIFVPLDTTPFKVSEKDIVRLVGAGIAGSNIEATVVGPAKVESKGSIHRIKSGMPVIGNTTVEFNIKPTGKGKVKVTITIKPPQPGAKPDIKTYEFEVE
jgi:hypothetical protein